MSCMTVFFSLPTNHQIRHCAPSKIGCQHGTRVDNQSVGSSVPVVNRWLGPGDRIFLEVASMVITQWIVAFLRSDS